MLNSKYYYFFHTRIKLIKKIRNKYLSKQYLMKNVNLHKHSGNNQNCNRKFKGKFNVIIHIKRDF